MSKNIGARPPRPPPWIRLWCSWFSVHLSTLAKDVGKGQFKYIYLQTNLKETIVWHHKNTDTCMMALPLIRPADNTPHIPVPTPPHMSMPAHSLSPTEPAHSKQVHWNSATRGLSVLILSQSQEIRRKRVGPTFETIACFIMPKLKKKSQDKKREEMRDRMQQSRHDAWQSAQQMHRGLLIFPPGI